jgi:hypothetical protein
VINTSYLTDKFKGVYRILPEVDTLTNDFPRKLNGSYEYIDCYISCQHNIKIYHYGKSILQAYIPSLQRGNNIIKAIQGINPDIISNIYRTDSEVEFLFKYSDSETIIPLLKPKTSGSGISPFSSKNRPKTAYIIPDEDLCEYKEIVQNVPQNELITISHSTNNFIKSLATKKNPIENIKADMKLKGLTGKNYIHSIGKWDEYIKYLKGNL